MKPVLLTSQEIMRNLTQILYHLTPAVDRSGGRYEVGDVIALCLQGHMFLWAVSEGESIRAVCVVQFADYPRKRVLLFAFCGGSGMAWAELIDDILAWGKERGCVEADADDARGGAWGRVLGWKERYRKVGREI